MKIHFHLPYQTTIGQTLQAVVWFSKDGQWTTQTIDLASTDQAHWQGTLDFYPAQDGHVMYYYQVLQEGHPVRQEWKVSPRIQPFHTARSAYYIYDLWRDLPPQSWLYSTALAPQTTAAFMPEFPATIMVRAYIAGLQKAQRVVDLGIKIVLVDVQGELYLLELDDALILFRFFFALLLIEPVFAVIHDLAHRRRRLRRDLDEIKVSLRGDPERFGTGHDAQLFAAVGDHADLAIPDLFVDLQFPGSYTKTPPKLKYGFPVKNKCGRRAPAIPYKRNARRNRAFGLWDPEKRNSQGETDGRLLYLWQYCSTGAGVCQPKNTA